MRPGSLLARTPAWRSAPASGREHLDREALKAIAAQAAAALSLSILGGALIAVTGDWKVAAGLIGGGVFVALGMLRPALFLAALLAVRPLLDGLPGDPGQGLGVVLIGVCALALVRRPQVVRPGATGAFVALLAISALATLPAYLDFSGVIGLHPLTELVRLSALFAVYVLAAHVVATPQQMRRVLLIVAFSGVLPAVWAIGELLGNPEEIASLGLVRVSGSFVNPVALSAYLAVTVLIMLSLPRGDVPRWLRGPALGLMITALISSYGREGWALLLLAIIMLHWRSNKRAIVGVAVVCTAFVLFLPGVQDRVLPSESVTGSDSTSTFASYDWRLGNWRGLLTRYGERPLSGFGLETTTLVNPKRLLGDTRDATNGFQAHNAGVRALVEGGPLLLAAVLAVFAALIGSLWRIARVRTSPLWPYARLLTAAWVATLIIALTTSDLLDATALVYALLAMAGAIEGAYRREAGTASAGAPPRVYWRRSPLSRVGPSRA